MKRYPRDFQGYGANAPDPKWPNGARIALQFVINYEEGGENCVLHGDAASEAFLSEIVGAAAGPGTVSRRSLRPAAAASSSTPWAFSSASAWSSP